MPVNVTKTVAGALATAGALLLSASLLGAESNAESPEAPISLTEPEWSMDPDGLDDYWARGGTRKPCKVNCPMIEVEGSNPVQVVGPRDALPPVTVAVVIRAEPDEPKSAIPLDSLRVVVRKGLGWKTVTGEVREYVETTGCDDVACDRLELRRDVDFQQYGPGTYQFDVRVTNIDGNHVDNTLEIGIKVQ